VLEPQPITMMHKHSQRIGASDFKVARRAQQANETV
jgi:hypothetical protein